MHDPRVNGPAWLRSHDPQNPRNLGMILNARRLDPALLPVLVLPSISSLPPLTHRRDAPSGGDVTDELATLRAMYEDVTLGPMHVAVARGIPPLGDYLAAWTRIAAVRRVVLGGQPATEPRYWVILDQLADHLLATGVKDNRIAASLARKLARDPEARLGRWYPPAMALKRNRSSHPTGAAIGSVDKRHGTRIERDD